MRNDRPMDRTLTMPLRRPCAQPGASPGRVTAMIRHVVLFTWSADADPARRAATVAALRNLRSEVGGMTALTVTDDAGLVDGNADTVLVADFPDVESFHRYAQEIGRAHV